MGVREEEVGYSDIKGLIGNGVGMLKVLWQGLKGWVEREMENIKNLLQQKYFKNLYILKNIEVMGYYYLIWKIEYIKISYNKVLILQKN